MTPPDQERMTADRPVGKIIDGLRDAVAGRVTSVTVAGVKYERLDVLAQAHARLLSEIAALRKVAEAARMAEEWFTKANVDGDEGCDFLNDDGWDEAVDVEQVLHDALSSLTPKETPDNG